MAIDKRTIELDKITSLNKFDQLLLDYNSAINAYSIRVDDLAKLLFSLTQERGGIKILYDAEFGTLKSNLSEFNGNLDKNTEIVVYDGQFKKKRNEKVGIVNIDTISGHPEEFLRVNTDGDDVETSTIRISTLTNMPEGDASQNNNLYAWDNPSQSAKLVSLASVQPSVGDSGSVIFEGSLSIPTKTNSDSEIPSTSAVEVAYEEHDDASLVRSHMDGNWLVLENTIRATITLRGKIDKTTGVDRTVFAYLQFSIDQGSTWEVFATTMTAITTNIDLDKEVTTKLMDFSADTYLRVLVDADGTGTNIEQSHLEFTANLIEVNIDENLSLTTKRLVDVSEYDPNKHEVALGSPEGLVDGYNYEFEANGDILDGDTIKFDDSAIQYIINVLGDDDIEAGDLVLSAYNVGTGGFDMYAIWDKSGEGNGGVAGVSKWNDRTGNVFPVNNDYTADQIDYNRNGNDDSGQALDDLYDLRTSDRNDITTNSTNIGTNDGKAFYRDGSKSMTGNIDGGNNKAINFADPTNNQHLATKKYVDDKAGDGGTIQATDGNTYNIRANNQGSVTGNARGEHSVDLQTDRSNSNEVVSGFGSFTGGGRRNKITGVRSFNGAGESNSILGSNSFNGAGNGNTIDGDNSSIIVGSNNTITGNRNVILSGTNKTITGNDKVHIYGQLSLFEKAIGVTPTADNHLATKKYVDDNAGGGVPDEGIGEYFQSYQNDVIGNHWVTAQRTGYTVTLSVEVDNTSTYEEVSITVLPNGMRPTREIENVNNKNFNVNDNEETIRVRTNGQVVLIREQTTTHNRTIQIIFRTDEPTF